MKLTSFSNHNTIAHITVGKDANKFSISTDILCHHSGYFRGALKGGFAETIVQKVDLREADPEAFEIILEWLYTHTIKEVCPSPRTTLQDDQPSFAILLETWKLADYLQIPKVQNHIMALMTKRINKHKCVPVAEFNELYKIKDEHPLLQSWIVDIAIWAAPFYLEFTADCIKESAFRLLTDVSMMMSLLVYSRTRPSKKFTVCERYLMDVGEEVVEDEEEDDDDEEVI